jgi:hypothetical protein
VSDPEGGSAFSISLSMLVVLHGGAHEEGASFLRSTQMVQIHAGFELLAWGLLLNLGSVFGRYMKPTQEGPSSWFSIHRGLQLSGSLLSLLGFGVVFAHLSVPGYTHFQGPHQFFGLVLLVLAALQGLLGWRSHLMFLSRGTSTSLLQTLHRWLGRLLLPLGFVVVGFGLDLYSKDILKRETFSESPIIWLSFLGLVFCCATAVVVLQMLSATPNDQEASSSLDSTKLIYFRTRTWKVFIITSTAFTLCILFAIKITK